MRQPWEDQESKFLAKGTACQRALKKEAIEKPSVVIWAPQRNTYRWAHTHKDTHTEIDTHTHNCIYYTHSKFGS